MLWYSGGTWERSGTGLKTERELVLPSGTVDQDRLIDKNTPRINPTLSPINVGYDGQAKDNPKLQ